MHLDARDLRRFYLRTHLGRAAGWHIRDAISRLWPQEQIEGQTVVGYGFATPILRPFMDRARRVSALMPGQQGVFAWPATGKNLAVLCEETSWPLDTGSVDRLVVLHGLETCENPARLLDECWRVLGPGGHAIFIVPNRAGLWSRRDKTPFGYGRPYSVGQLETQLKAHNFVPETHIGALYQPPSHRRFWVRTGGLWEKVGRHLPAALASGVILVEATKQVYAPTRGGLGDAIKAPLEALGGLTKTPPRPVSNRAGFERRSSGGKDR